MSPATVGWLCLALALLPLGAIVGMCVAERYRVEYRRDMWRIPWQEAAMAKQRRLDENRPAAPATTLAEVDERTEFAEELPPAIERCSGYTSPTVVLLDEPRYELPEGVEGIPIGTRWPIPYEPRHGEHATAPHSAYRPRHSLLADITDEFAAIVAGAWSTQERESLALEWWCPSCRGDLEHGRAHEACDACACPCTLVEVS